MCVIINLPKNVSLPYSILQAGYENNPDGWGIMAMVDGILTVVKEKSDFNAFKKAWRDFRPDTDRAIHFRWATHGETDTANCHPFPVTPDLFMMHNGIIRTVEVDKKMSDSWNFATHDLGQPEIINSYGPDAIERPDFKKMVEDCTTGSRLLFMDTKGRILRTATWEKKYGAFFSNSSNYTSKSKGYAGSGHNSGYGYGAGWRYRDGWGEHAGDDYSGNYTGRNGRGKDYYTKLTETGKIADAEATEAEEQGAFSDLVPYGRTIDGATGQDYVPRKTAAHDSEPMTLQELEVMEENDVCDWVQDNPWEATDLILELIGRERESPLAEQIA